MKHQLRLAAAGAVLAASLSACSSGNPIGPFGGPYSPAQQCVPLASNHVITYGDEFVRNPATAVAVIDKMALANPKGLRVFASWIVPTKEMVGVRGGYPSGHLNLPGWQWDKRQSPDGATVPHTRGKYQKMSLVFVVGLKSGLNRGRAIGTDIWYHVGSQHYHLRTSTALLVIRGRSC